MNDVTERGFLQPIDAWDALSLEEQAAMMEAAVSEGIYDLKEIRHKYNQFAEGGSEEEVEVNTNNFNSGGSIHIKPENRGKFTVLKERTGHSASWFKENGTPAQKKMATFALNARKWKHSNGGNLFEEGGKPNIFRRSDGTYFYQEDPNSEEVTVTPLNTLFEDPAQWTYTDNDGKVYTPRQVATPFQGTATKKEEEGPLVEAAKNYLGELQYDINNNIPVKGKYTMPAIAASAILPIAGNAFAGTTMAGIPTITWADAALTSGFGAHGLQNLANGNANWETALEVAPLGRLTKPTHKVIESSLGLVKSISNNTKIKPTEIINSKKPIFISELDWSPESWFKTRVNRKYDKKDIASLKSHVPEYLQIEQQAKADGTWLKMPDGSTWQGDPRSWVQMQSDAYNNYTGNSPFKQQPFAHSSDAVFDTFDIGKFGKTDRGFYGKGFYTHPAENVRGKLQGRNNYGDNIYLLTTNVQKPLDLNNPSFEYAGLFNWENTNAPKGIFDGYDSVYYGIPGIKNVGAYPAELVVPKPINYKSLLGNNGNFSLLNPNMYKSLLPLGIATTAVSKSSK